MTALPTVVPNKEVAFAALCQSVQRMDPMADMGLVERCYRFADEHHEGKLRKSGDPYIVHPIAVASLLAEIMRIDVPSICAALLHDTIEDTAATGEDIRALAGAEVQHLVEGVTKLGQIELRSREERQAESFRKMVLAMTRDVRVLLIKLADRTDNMRTLQYMPPDKQDRIARETRDIYAPMANRLGMSWMKNELEDLCFRFLEPDEWQKLVERLEATRPVRETIINEVVRHVQARMDEERVPAQVVGTTKSLWSIHKKVQHLARELDRIHDIMSFRVVTMNTRECYTALGVLHTHYTPIPGRFKDYIALPKPNMYQSLHTTVVGPRTDRIELQVRTRDMDRIADCGIVAAWGKQRRLQSAPPRDSEYVDDGALIDGGDEVFLPASGFRQPQGRALDWLHQLTEWQRTLQDSSEFMDTVKSDLFEAEVIVFTPQGDAKTLPKGSTPVDFAYAVHSKVGDGCSGARVNGLIVPLRYVLRNGDTIEILTAEKQKPTKEWLKFVFTSRAKTRVRHRLRSEQRERSRQYGRDLLARELRDRNLDIAALEREGRLQSVATGLRISGGADEMLVLIGYGKFSANHVARVMDPEPNRPEDLPVGDADPAGAVRARPSRRLGSGVAIADGIDHAIRYATCCGPIPGEPIVGFLGGGRAQSVIIHVRDCPKSLDQDPARRVDASWSETPGVYRPVELKVVCADRPGILASLTRSYSEQGLNIAQARCRATDEQRSTNTFLAMFSNIGQLRSLTRSLYAIEGVVSVTRNPSVQSH
ncbi:MAG: bifunctional (p)ppGpp synthetase/guanosine-3',5'-bis(diphosphate) 3'-pyrophosphohydrolase [Deltaproteobacteria bacterium]|nr:bifunctional (p)ppGpp synthetase/guanosine-3',5'-bis(diphosphate) 3'-pyrophosphohydrolase [Deltaproteobacteria bacterium]